METVIYEKKNNIAYVTLNRPEVLNAINFTMTQELGGIWKDFAEDDSLNVAIITGNGRAFCAGHDMKPDVEAYRRGEEPKVTSLPLSELRESLKPTICAVNGLVAGGGLSLVLACDIVVCSDKAEFIPVFVALGHHGGGQMPQLAIKTTVSWALWTWLYKKSLDAETAYRIGLVAEVFPHDELMSRATEMAETMCSYSQISLRSVKERINYLMRSVYKDTMDYRGPVTAEIRRSADYREGARSFEEKRAPRFQQRIKNE